MSARLRSKGFACNPVFVEEALEVATFLAGCPGTVTSYSAAMGMPLERVEKSCALAYELP